MTKQEKKKIKQSTASGNVMYVRSSVPFCYKRSVPSTLGLDQGRRSGNGMPKALSRMPVFPSKISTRWPNTLEFLT